MLNKAHAMILLAIEQSAPTAAAAVLDQGRVRAQRCWTDSRFHHQQLFDFVEAMLAEAGVRLPQVDAFAVGLGPGSYTGLRTALAAARAFAMPGGRPVYGISSAEVIASQVLDQARGGSVVVLGDARRGQLWARRYAAAPGNEVAPRSDWLLFQEPELGETLSGAALAVTAEWDRLGAVLEKTCPPGVRLLREACPPSAVALGDLAFRRMAAGVVAPPLVPIYLHAPVAGRPPAPLPAP